MNILKSAPLLAATTILAPACSNAKGDLLKSEVAQISQICNTALEAPANRITSEIDLRGVSTTTVAKESVDANGFENFERCIVVSSTDYSGDLHVGYFAETAKPMPNNGRTVTMLVEFVSDNTGKSSFELINPEARTVLTWNLGDYPDVEGTLFDLSKKVTEALNSDAP